MSAASAASAAKPKRPLVFWLSLGLLLFATPIFIVGLGAASMFRLSREAALLRQEVVAATNADWHAKVQVSVGWGTLAAARTVLRFSEHEHLNNARLALSAVRRASVGVYERNGRRRDWSREQLLARADARMRDRGWSRVVGVTEPGDEAVLVYANDDVSRDGQLDLCLAVVHDDEMVVIATRIDANKFVELAQRHMRDRDFRRQLKQLKI